MHKLLQFGQQNIRVIMDEQDNPWWVAQDICAVLDITKVAQAIEKLRLNEKGICLTDTLGGEQQLRKDSSQTEKGETQWHSAKRQPGRNQSLSQRSRLKP